MNDGERDSQELRGAKENAMREQINDEVGTNSRPNRIDHLMADRSAQKLLA